MNHSLFTSKRNPSFFIGEFHYIDLKSEIDYFKSNCNLENYLEDYNIIYPNCITLNEFLLSGYKQYGRLLVHKYNVIYIKRPSYSWQVY